MRWLARLSCSTAASTSATSSRGTRPDDRPVAVARLHGGVRGRLGAQVDAEHVVVTRRVLGADRADDHVGHRTFGGGLEQLDRPVAVNGELALGAAPGSGACGEHDSLGVLHRRGDLLDRRVLEVAHDRIGAGRLHVRGVSRVADQSDHAVAPSEQPGGQPHRDVPVCSCDCDQHEGTSVQRRSRSASCRSAYLACAGDPERRRRSRAASSRSTLGSYPSWRWERT